MKRHLWKTGLTLLGLLVAAGSVWLHVRSQERYDTVWLGAGDGALNVTTQDGCLEFRLAGVGLNRWFGHESQIIGEMPPLEAWSFDFAQGPSGITGTIAVPLWLAASGGLALTFLPWIPHRG